jgi:predicted MFS family arabinose efflux permease
MLGVLGGTALVGALAYSAVGHRLPRRRTFLWCFTVVPIGYLVLAALPPLWVALVALAVVGFAAGPINPLIFTVMTEIVPANLRGRAFGAVRAGAWASIPLGILLGSVMVAAVGVAATLLAMGTLLAAVVAYGFFNPAFREMDR